jgi:hypothetical protein
VSAYEEPSYTTEREYEGFELRRYAPRLVVETRVAGDFATGRNEAFGRLFAYISGNNNAGAKVSMTVPVTSSSDGSRIAMTVPVTSETNGREQRMQFFVPSAYTAETVPQPRDPSVAIRELPETLLAVRRYSGRSTEENFRRELAELRRLVAAAGLQVEGEGVLAVYNGPFTPWFMRRNEVLLEVRRGEKQFPGDPRNSRPRDDGLRRLR